jgi:hypothetical protein
MTIWGIDFLVALVTYGLRVGKVLAVATANILELPTLAKY